MTKMTIRSAWAVAAAALLTSAPSAFGAETFTLGLSGQGHRWLSLYECGGCALDDPVWQAGYDFAWTGTATLVTASAADGVYAGGSAGGDLLSFTMTSPLGTIDIANPGWYAPMVTISAVLANGGVTSIQTTLLPSPYDRYVFDGLNVSYNFGGCPGCGKVIASGMLSAVPEPSSLALMALGIGALGLLRRRKTG